MEEKQKEVTQKIAPKIQEFAETLVNLKIKEVQELLTCLKVDHGIEPAAAAAAPAAAASVEATEKEEKTAFTVVLKSVPTAKKLSVIKEVKKITGKILKEAKTMVDEAPSTIKEDIPKAEAEAIKKGLEEAGAEVELK